MIALPIALPQERAADWIDWSNTTNIHPVSIAVMALMALLMLLLRRENAMWPIVLVLCFITVAQRFVVAELDFPVLRVMVMVGWMRIIARREYTLLRLQPLDKALLLWAIVMTVANVSMMFTVYPANGVSQAIYRSGWLFDNVGVYFLFRVFIQTWKDVERYVDALALMAVPVAIFFLIEKSTGRNLFSFLGGVPEITKIRQGRLRCQGCFSHPILAGCFWAGLMPLFFCRILANSAFTKFVSATAMLCVLSIIFATSSSTPVMALIFTFAAIGLYAVRYQLPFLRWTIVATLVALHMVMQKPVWHLIARIDFVGGSTGYHRFALIDAFITRFDEWWIFGTYSTGHWGYHLFDVTNFFVLQGVDGGIAGIVLFLSMLFFAFRSVHRLLKALRPGSMYYWMTWLLGVALFAHCMNFLAVAYFQKSLILFLLQLATITSLEVHVRRTYAIRARQTVEHENTALA